MATQTAPLEAAWTPSQALAVDHVENEIYSSRYAELRVSRFAIGTLGVFADGINGRDCLSRAPSDDQPLHPNRRDGQGLAIASTDLSYSPREGEIRTYLTD